MARPNGNITGFSNLEYSLIGKWLQLFKEAAPGLTQVGLMISTIQCVLAKVVSNVQGRRADFGN